MDGSISPGDGSKPSKAVAAMLLFNGPLVYGYGQYPNLEMTRDWNGWLYLAASSRQAEAFMAVLMFTPSLQPLLWSKRVCSTKLQWLVTPVVVVVVVVVCCGVARCLSGPSAAAGRRGRRRRWRSRSTPTPRASRGRQSLRTAVAQQVMCTSVWIVCLFRGDSLEITYWLLQTMILDLNKAPAFWWISNYIIFFLIFPLLQTVL